jgi:hypothetical protein
LQMLCKNWGQYIVNYCFKLNVCMCVFFHAVLMPHFLVPLPVWDMSVSDAGYTNVWEITKYINKFSLSKVIFLSLKIQRNWYKNIYWILYFQL